MRPSHLMALPLLLLAGLALPAASRAQVNYRVQPVPATWELGRTRVVSYELSLVTGLRPEGVTVAFEPPQYDNRGGDPVGSPLEDLQPLVSGAGLLTGVVAFRPQPYELGTCVRTPENRVGALFLSLPANSATLVQLRFVLHPPLSTGGFNMPIRITSNAGQRLSFRSPAPRIIGRRSLGIRLSAPRRSGETPEAVRIRGITSPRLAGKRIVLRRSTPRDSFRGLFRRRLGYRKLATVRVGSSGRFSYVWRTRGRGWFQIKATFPGDRRFTRDQSCPRALLLP